MIANSTANEGRPLRGLGWIVFFVVALLIWLNKYSIYQIINDAFTPSIVEWRDYVIDTRGDYRVIAANERTLTLLSEQEPTASLDLIEYRGELAPPRRSVESFCSRVSCSGIQDDVIKIGDTNAMSSRARYTDDGQARVVEFIHLPHTTIEIKLRAPESLHENLRAIVAGMRKTSASS